MLTTTHRNPFSIFNPEYGFRMNDFFEEETQDYRIEKKEDRLNLSVDLPGVKISDISVAVDDRILTIEYTLRNKTAKKEFSIHKMYDTSTAKAKLEDGVLDIEFMRSQQNQKRKINVEVK